MSYKWKVKKRMFRIAAHTTVLFRLTFVDAPFFIPSFLTRVPDLKIGAIQVAISELQKAISGSRNCGIVSLSIPQIFDSS